LQNAIQIGSASQLDTHVKALKSPQQLAGLREQHPTQREAIEPLEIEA
jgi:hypothetical protein